MKRMYALLGGAVIVTGVGIGAFAHDPTTVSTEGKQVTVQGELVDTACFITSNGDEKGKDHAKCAMDCMASGIPAGILPAGSKDSDAVMFLLTNPKVLAPYAAQTIKIEGIQFDDKHAFDVKKLSVKQGNGWKEIQLQDEHHSAASTKPTDPGMKEMPGMKDMPGMQGMPGMGK